MAEATAMPTTQGFWAGMGTRLSNWGSKIKGFAFRVGSYIKRAASWLWHTAPVKWVASKVTWLAGRFWFYAKGPVGWVTAPILAIIFAPKAVAVMLFLVLILIAILAYLVYRLTRELKENTTPEEFSEIKDELNDLKDSVRSTWNDLTTEVPDEELDPNETLAERYKELDGQLGLAIGDEDENLVSELTGRLHLVLVRSGKGSKLKKDSTISVIHRDARKQAEANQPNFRWNFNRMYQAVRSEDRRVKDIAELKAKGSHLTSV
jgi:hypothetical protein